MVSSLEEERSWTSCLCFDVTSPLKSQTKFSGSKSILVGLKNSTLLPQKALVELVDKFRRGLVDLRARHRPADDEKKRHSR